MSMINEHVKELRETAHSLEIFPIHDFTGTARMIKQAADTIESLSAKLQAVNMENGGGWIACEDRLPSQGGIYYLITAKENTLYHVTFAKWQPRYKEWDLRGRRQYWKVIAWQPMPEPYHEP